MHLIDKGVCLADLVDCLLVPLGSDTCEFQQSEIGTEVFEYRDPRREGVDDRPDRCQCLVDVVQCRFDGVFVEASHVEPDIGELEFRDLPGESRICI